MNMLRDMFRQAAADDNFDAIRIGIASPEKIRSWSYGEVGNNQLSHLQART